MSDPLDGFYAALDGYIQRAVAPLRETIKTQQATIERLETASKSMTPADEVASLRARVDEQVATIKAIQSREPIRGIDGKDGASVDPVEVRAMVLDAVKTLPIPKDGKDAVSIVGSSVDADGVLLLTLSDGSIQRPGRVKGADGRNAEPLPDVDGMVWAAVKSAVAEIPRPRDGKDGTDGKSIDVAEVQAMVATAVASIQRPRDGIDGKSVEIDDIAAIAKDYIDEAISALPKPKDGRDGDDGKSVEPEIVKAFVQEHVALAVAAIPIPKDGKDGKDGVDGQAVAIHGKNGASAFEIAKAHGFSGSELDWLASLRGRDGTGTNGKDGASILSALVDADGELVLTASDGTKHKAGVVRGRDGTSGVDGSPGLKGEPGRDAASLRVLPYIDDAKSFPAGSWAVHAGGSWFAEKATEPLNGRSPVDAGWTPIAVGEQSLSIALADDERTVVITRTTSTGLKLERKFTLPIVLDRGVYAASKQYARGDGITRSGSFYIAKVNGPKGLPGASDDWRLAVKAGKDGKSE